MFLRKSRVERDPLAVTMSGVRLGERVLQIDGTDARLVALIAVKSGLTGTAAIVVADERAAAQTQRAIGDAGALADVRVVPSVELPFEESAFDVIVVHDAARVMAAMDAAARSRWLAECRRVLRDGGRIIAIESGSPVGLRALWAAGASGKDAGVESGGTPATLRSAGFRSVRLLADKEGSRFIEGVKTD